MQAVSTSQLDFPPSFVLNRLDWKGDEYGNERTTQARSAYAGYGVTGPPFNYGEASIIFGEIQVLLAEKRTELLNANAVACSAS